MIKQLDIFGNITIPDEEVEAIPYMGNKRILATKFINAMFRTVGEFDTLYDLFGGGASVSVAGIKAGLKVHYNDLNEGIVNLLRHIQKGGEIPFNFVTREEFFRHKDGNDWYSGLIKSCYSFGNNQGCYLFGKDIELFKKECHEYLMANGYDKTPEIRINLIAQFKKEKGIEGRLRLEQLERLQQLQQLQQLDRLEITCLSYENVEIKEGVVYCDIPYKNTAKYQSGKDFDYEKFYNWALNMKNPVFISEYSMPDDFQCVAEFEHRSTLSAINKSKRTIEKLFWNKVRLTDLI
ncbi:MAG TPA: DNA adenine methylase [bacterium]|nr:DNA adenine methylase [bacterium]